MQTGGSLAVPVQKLGVIQSSVVGQRAWCIESLRVVVRLLDCRRPGDDRRRAGISESGLLAGCRVAVACAWAIELGVPRDQAGRRLNRMRWDYLRPKVDATAATRSGQPMGRPFQSLGALPIPSAASSGRAKVGRLVT